MRSLAFFPSLIWHRKIPAQRRGLIADLIKDARVFQRQDTQGRKWCKINYFAGYTSYGSMDQLHRISPHYHELAQLLDREVALYAKELQFGCRPKDFKLVSLWVNIMKQGCTHSGHLHPQSVISGTFYLQVPKGGAGLVLEDPRLPLFMHAPPRKKSTPKQQQHFAQIQSKPGEVILFESWLKHEVPVNRSTQDRISISFNYDWLP